jgi:hypothetical protein
MNLSPEGGEGKAKGGSFWVCGKRIFGFDPGDNPMCFFDSPFFNYAHASPTEKEDEIIATMAITNASALQKLGEVSIEDDDYLAIPFPIPREKIFLLQIRIKTGKKSFENSRRTRGQIAERELFKLIEEILLQGYELGGEKIKELDLEKIEDQSLSLTSAL